MCEFKACIYVYIYMLVLVNLWVGHTYARAHLWDIRPPPPVLCFPSTFYEVGYFLLKTRLLGLRASGTCPECISHLLIFLYCSTRCYWIRLLYEFLASKTKREVLPDKLLDQRANASAITFFDLTFMLQKLISMCIHVDSVNFTYVSLSILSLTEILLIPKNYQLSGKKSFWLDNYWKIILSQAEGPYHHCPPYCEALERSMCQSSSVHLLLFLLSSSFCKLLTTKEATLFEDEYHSHHTGQQEPKHVQWVILDPAEVMGSHTKMLGSFVTHDKLNPEDCSVQGLHWLVVVDSW